MLCAFKRQVYSSVSMNQEQITRERHAEMRRRDADDVATGRYTAQEVNQRNAWIPNPQDWVTLNLLEATCAL